MTRKRARLSSPVPSDRSPGSLADAGNLYSARADSGNDHSNEKPNFVAGVAGGCGWAFLVVAEPASAPSIPCSTADFVSVPIASLVTVGAIQGRPRPGNDLSDFIGRASEVIFPKAFGLRVSTGTMTPSSFAMIG